MNADNILISRIHIAKNMSEKFKKYSHQGVTFITISAGDITNANTDAVVNAANHTLLGGGGVDGAIHTVAGPELLEECKLIGGCHVGQVKITKGYNLPARYILHAVGPIYGREGGREKQLLVDCYINSLIMAHNLGLKSIVFPAISTGAFGYPFEEAAEVVAYCMLHVSKNKKEIFDSFDQINFIFNSEEKRDVFSKIFNKIYAR